MNGNEAIKAIKAMNLSANDTQALIDIVLDVCLYYYNFGYDEGYNKAREDCW